MEPRTRGQLLVRIWETKERTLPGWVVGVLGGMVLLACVYSTDDHPYLLVGLALATWAAGPMLAFRPGARIAMPEATEHGMRVGHLLVPHGATAHVAKARRGASVAMSFGKGDGLFFEVASMEEARALVALAGADESRPVDLRLRYDSLRAATAATGFVATSCGLAYAVTVGAMGEHGYKGTFGLPGLVLAIAASFLYLLAQLARRNVVVSGPGSDEGVWGAIGRHLQLHARAMRADVTSDDHGTEANDGTPPRVRVMLKADEPTRGWLARIDGAASGGEGYRGVSPSREELTAVLVDPKARADLRLAAARVLVRHHDEPLDSVMRPLDPQLRVYASLVAAEDADRAADELDALGPMFRALE